MYTLKTITIALFAFIAPISPGQHMGPCDDLGECAKGSTCESSDVAWICAPTCESTAECEAAFPGLNVDCIGTGADGIGECWSLCSEGWQCPEAATCTDKGVCLYQI